MEGETAMKVLFITIAWPNAGERNLYSDLLEEFKKNGHDVFVACADEKSDTTSIKVESGMNILRFPTLQIRKAGKLQKALSLLFLGWKFRNNINKHYAGHNFDLIIAHTPPITLSGLMIYLKRKYDAFFYLLLKDIWPHSNASLNIIKKGGIIYRYFRWHEKRIYDAADMIGCMSPKNVEYILKKNNFLDKQNVEECPNSIIPRTFEPKNRNGIRAKYGIPEDATVFIFSGNLGKGHGLKFYLDTIEALNDYDKAYFLIGGSGTQYSYLEATLAEKDLDNIFLYEWLPKEDFNEILLTSDVGMILLSSQYTVPQFPSRLLAYLEASKPVLCAVNKETDIGTIVEDAGCGISVPHGEQEELIGAIKRLSEDERWRNELALNSRVLLESRYTCKDSYSIIMSHFKQYKGLRKT